MAAPIATPDAVAPGPEEQNLPPVPGLSLAPLQTDLGKPRKRKRPQPIRLGAEERVRIAQRVVKFYADDERAREHAKELREQRYAKMMQFEPAPEFGDDLASNVQLSDILGNVLRMEDQIQNSVISTRPIMNSRARQEVNRGRERKVDLLLDHQFFVEQDGEALIETLTSNFFRDGQFTCLTHWVREFRKILFTRSWDPIEFGVMPRNHFERLLRQMFGRGRYIEMPDSDGWDWQVIEDDTKLLVRFYTEEDDERPGVIMQVEGEVESYKGPCSIAYEWEDVLAPLWSQNLQPPGPSNPQGAPHVILVDYPTRDEIIRGIEQGYYDLATVAELEGVDGYRDWTDGDRDLARQRHDMRGHGPVPTSGGSDDGDMGHNQIRRLMCFDTWEGLDVVWWVLEGPDILLRARPLTEMCPGLRPVRPIAHAVCMRVQGTWVGMGIPELMEATHDFQTAVFNQMVDAAALEIAPFFLYRQASNLKPEEFKLRPGLGIPTQNPQTDVVFHTIQPQATQVGTNMLAMARQDSERLTMQGDLQAGKIPTGSSAALRTSGGIQQVLAQGEARPERMLRRFFSGLRQVYEHMYRLDRHFLEDKKKFRAIGVPRPEEDPMVQIDRVADLGETHFEFAANVLNSSKVALQAALQEMLTIMGNPLMLQTGISTPDSLYRIIVDYVTSLGQNPEKYVNEPMVGAKNPPLYAHEALSKIIAGQAPEGQPAEGGYEPHLQALVTLLNAPDNMGVPFGQRLSPDERERVVLYAQSVQQKMMEAQQQFAMMQAAQSFAADQQQRPAPGGEGGGKPDAPIVSGAREQIDESMPAGTGTPG